MLSLGSPALRLSETNDLMPENTMIVRDSAFIGRADLTEITLPDSVEVIEKKAFHSAGITKINLSANLQHIGWSAFYASNLIRLDAPRSLQSIDWYAFGSCASLETIVIRNENTRIDADAFIGCRNIQRVYIKIDSSAYQSLSRQLEKYGKHVTYLPVEDYDENENVAECTIPEKSAYTNVNDSSKAPFDKSDNFSPIVAVSKCIPVSAGRRDTDTTSTTKAKKGRVVDTLSRPISPVSLSELVVNIFALTSTLALIVAYYGILWLKKMTPAKRFGAYKVTY